MVDGATLEMLCTATYRRFESCPLRQNPKIPHSMRDFLCFGGEDREERVPCGSRVGGKPTYAKAHTLAWETALSCPVIMEKLCYISPPRIICGIFCVLAERTAMKRFLVVRMPEGCLQPEEIRRGSGSKQKNEA